MITDDSDDDHIQKDVALPPKTRVLCSALIGMGVVISMARAIVTNKSIEVLNLFAISVCVGFGLFVGTIVYFMTAHPIWEGDSVRAVVFAFFITAIVLMIA